MNVCDLVAIRESQKKRNIFRNYFCLVDCSDGQTNNKLFYFIVIWAAECLSWNIYKVFMEADTLVRKEQCLHVYIISMAAFERKRQNWQAVTKTVCSTKPNIFIRPSKVNVFWFHRIQYTQEQTNYIFLFFSPSEAKLKYIPSLE